MKNYKEKEKKLDSALNKLDTLTVSVEKMNNDISLLNLQKNQLLSEKEESVKNFNNLTKQHNLLKSEIEKVNKDIGDKFGDKKNFNQKIDELNQETENHIDEIEKWQT